MTLKYKSLGVWFPELSPTENIWCIMKHKRREPMSFEQLESYNRQERENIPFPKVQQLVSSVPRCLQTGEKKRECCTVVNIKFELGSFFFIDDVHLIWLTLTFVIFLFWDLPNMILHLPNMNNNPDTDSQSFFGNFCMTNYIMMTVLPCLKCYPS